jgi:hypothetical protein
VPSASVAASVVVDASRPPSTSAGSSSVDAVAVSSRVDNGTESPQALYDGDTDTAWSSRTGDLAGAWVAFRFKKADELREVALTVGMTKSDELFRGNVRVTEVSVSFDDVVLAGHVKLDVESKALQPIAIAAKGPGVLKITIDAVKPGTHASWKEATISEVEIRGPAGKLRVDPSEIDVGSFKPKGRGVLGLIPEQNVELGCVAMMPSVPRVFCVIGQRGNNWKSESLVAIERDDSKVIAPLMSADSFDARFLKYDDWLRAEREARGAVPLPTASTSIPWKAAVQIEGATFRQRGTGTETPSEAQGVLEVTFPGETKPTEIFGEVFPIPSAPMSASAKQVGAFWLVERSAGHGSEGWFMHEADAALCDLRAHKCHDASPPPDVNESR